MKKLKYKDYEIPLDEPMVYNRKAAERYNEKSIKEKVEYVKESLLQTITMLAYNEDICEHLKKVYISVIKQASDLELSNAIDDGLDIKKRGAE